MATFTCRVVVVRAGCPFRATPSKILEFNAPFCLGEAHHYFNQCDLFCSFHAIVEVQFGGLVEWVLRNIIVCA